MSKAITVHAPDKMNLEQCQKALASILTKAGHTGCFSGFKISFESVVDPANLHVMIDKAGQINELGHIGH